MQRNLRSSLSSPSLLVSLATLCFLKSNCVRLPLLFTYFFVVDRLVPCFPVCLSGFTARLVLPSLTAQVWPVPRASLAATLARLIGQRAGRCPHIWAVKGRC